MNNNEREQAGEHQGSDYLEKTTNDERTELGHARNQKVVSDIQEYLAQANAAHPCH
jgi:hypothetical protein